MAKQIRDSTKFTGVRLPDTIRPLHYDLVLKPNLKNFVFSGTVKIHYELTQEKPLNGVVLHAADLEIIDGNVGTSKLTTVTYGDDTETATLDFDEPIPSTGVIDLEFSGILNDQLKGFYRTEFDLGETHIVAATTHFEPTAARRCFPCWDEPAIRATFTITVVYPRFADPEKRYQNIALSNMSISKDGTNPDDSLWVTFDKTPKMSTYLLAVIVGPFERVEGSDGKRPICVYTVPGKRDQGKFALEVASKALPFFEEYFEVEYPLKKMDLIAIPDFVIGAMENWGLVTYRESCLLVDPLGTSTERKQYIALIVSHELSHMWFGNLVTVEWWTHLWLKEGFASFMMYLCADRLYPQFDLFTQFLASNLGGALNLDALHSSHPIEVPVKNPNEISEIFDFISYNKGASVIRMMYSYIGDSTFRRGMREYLNKFAYSHAATEDLWDSLGEASNKPIREMMSGWTSQMGFPWLSVSLADETKQESNKLRLSVVQSKFVVDGKLGPVETTMKWQIPLSAISSASTKSINLGLMKDKQTEVSVDVSAATDWVKLNSGSIGYYRVAYSEELINRLLPAISSQTLPRTDRLGLQSDYFALCQAGCVSTNKLLELLEAYKNERDYTVWLSIDGSLSRLSVLLADTDCKKHLQAFGRSLYSEIFRRVTWEPKVGETDNEAMLRGVVVSRLVSLGDEVVIEEASRRFKAHLAKKAPIPADLRRAVYKSIAIHGGVEGFNNLLSLYKEETLHEERNRILVALGFSRDVKLLQQGVELMLSDEVRNQDRGFFFQGLGACNPAFAFSVIRDRKDEMRSKLENCGGLLRNIIECIFGNFTSEEKAREVEEFFSANSFKSTERAVKQAIEKIRVNAQWLARDGQLIESYLKSK